MEKIVTIHQPDFIPWLGFFDRWKNSDVYIVLDDVQFLRRGWHHRDKIKTVNGAAWLTVPVLKKGRYDQLIKETKIDDKAAWRRKHLRAIELSYRKAPNFFSLFEKIKDIYAKNYSFLIDLNMELLNFIAGEFGITTPVIFSSELNVKTTGTQRLVDLVKMVSGSIYLTGSGSKDYLEEPIFNNENLKVAWQEYEHPVYKQLNGKFIPMLSSLDFLMVRDNTA